MRRLVKLYMAAVGRLQARHGVHFCHICVRELPGPGSPVPPPPLPGLAVRALEEAELLPWCRDPRLELDEASVRAAFARGEACVAAFEGAALVGYAWFAYGRAPHVRGVWVEFDGRSRYYYRAFVRPDRRGRRIGHFLHEHTGDASLARGRTLDIAFIDLYNLPSLRAIRHGGGRTVGYAGYLAPFGLFLPFRTPGARRHGFRFVRAPAKDAPLERAIA